MKIKLVRQKDLCGCGIACISMVTKIPYKTVKKSFNNDFSTEGIDTRDMVAFICDQGYSVLHKESIFYNRKDDFREELLKPFAPVHIVNLKSYVDNEGSHVVVMDEAGVLYCPDGFSDESIRNCYRIKETWGFIK